ncbi:hypothetical protein P5673_001045 [Acropora cervicornis]|uniref:Uncharacterized protein n=1 Tax=Acropora cervicornis TaxID=6130 RepID=A0AAD9VGT8_ACRCE|nr:hypothetical protein P5673_001045 [Acropora cervicornis]
MDRNGVTPHSPKSGRKNHKHKVLDVEGVSEKLQDTPKSERKKLQKQKTGDSSRTTLVTGP